MIDIYDSKNIEKQHRATESYVANMPTAASSGAGKELSGTGLSNGNNEFSIAHACDINTGAYNSNAKDVHDDIDSEGDSEKEDSSNKDSYEEINDSVDRIKNMITEEDIADIQDMGMSAQKFTIKQFEEIVDNIKQMHIANDEALANQVEQIKEVARQFESMGEFDDKEIAKLLRMADIPVTAANIRKVEHTLSMAKVIPDISDSAKVYMIDNGVSLDIEQFYKAVYSSFGIHTGEGIADEVFENLKESFAGLTGDDEQKLADARWLLDNGLALNDKTMEQIADINQIVNDYSARNIVSFVTDAMSKGAEPEKTSLLEIRATMTFAAMNVVEARMAQGEDSDFDVVLKGMKELREQLLAKLFDAVKTDKEVNIMAAHGEQEVQDDTKGQFETVSKTMETVWKYTSVRKATPAKADEIDAKLFSKDVNISAYAQALDRYEQGSTQIRSDLGDSLKKAFLEISSLLETEGIEATKENVAAAKLLGYAQMDVTQENIMQMKEHMLRVSSTFEALKPAVVIKMVKDGINPLNMDFDTLNNKAKEIAAELGETKEEKYSQFLYNLEKNSQISEQERKAYIGIYRLIKAVEGTDNAAIATTVRSGRDFTLGNLLIAVRTLRGNGIDTVVDDEFGAIDYVVSGKNAIDEQIQAASKEFSNNDYSGAQSQNSSYSYENMLVEKTEERLLDGTLISQDVDNIEYIVDEKLETLAFVDKNKDKQNAVPMDTDNVTQEVVEFLENNEVPMTFENISAIKDYLKGTAPLSTDKQRAKNFSEKFVDALREDGADNFDSLGDMFDEFLDQESSILEDDILKQYTYKDAKVMLDSLARITFAKKMTENRVFDIPYENSSGQITNMRVSFVTGQTKKVEIALETVLAGKVKASVTVENEEISVNVLSDFAKGVDILRERSQTFVDELTKVTNGKVTIEFARMQAGETLKITGLPDARMQEVEPIDSNNSASHIDTAKLCKIAGTMIEVITQNS